MLFCLRNIWAKHRWIFRSCCHIKKGKAALAEYQHIAQVKSSLFKLDPYHLLFGTAACDDIWLVRPSQ